MAWSKGEHGESIEFQPCPWGYSLLQSPSERRELYGE